jgi:nanoRNase/pAp phosphatase (c-di-AMP/oligoRNAs hydrolase)
MSQTHFDLPKPIDQSRLEQLSAVAGKGPVLILTHDNPDPDALAAGYGLSILFEQAFNVQSRLVCSPPIGSILKISLTLHPILRWH